MIFDHDKGEERRGEARRGGRRQPLPILKEISVSMADTVSVKEVYGKFSDHVDRKSAAISVPKGEPAVVLFGGVLLSVELLRITHPDRHVNDFCSIYGEISVSSIENPSKPRVTLYNRSREDAETVAIGDHPQHNFLSLKDCDSAAQQPVLADFPIIATMKLFEKKATIDEDTLIATIEQEFEEFFDRLSGYRLSLDMKCESGFMFTLFYSIITPAILAEVDFKLNEDRVVGANKKRKGSIRIYGSIEAHQLVESKSSIRFYSKGVNEAEHVDFGSSISLDRKAVVMPISGAISIDYALHYDCHDAKEAIAQGTVSFYLKSFKCTRIKANRSLKHTKNTENGLFSVSITFIPILDPIPLEEYDTTPY